MSFGEISPLSTPKGQGLARKIEKFPSPQCTGHSQYFRAISPVADTHSLIHGLHHSLLQKFVKIVFNGAPDWVQVPGQNLDYFSLGAISVLTNRGDHLLCKLDSCNVLASLCFLLQVFSLHLLDFFGTKVWTHCKCPPLWSANPLQRPSHSNNRIFLEFEL